MNDVFDKFYEDLLEFMLDILCGSDKQLGQVDQPTESSCWFYRCTLGKYFSYEIDWDLIRSGAWMQFVLMKVPNADKNEMINRLVANLDEV